MENPDHINEIKKPASLTSETVDEPGLVYQKKANSKKIIFSSIQHQEQDNYLYWISLTPEARIASVTSLIREIFAEELKKNAATEFSLIRYEYFTGGAQSHTDSTASREG